MKYITVLDFEIGRVFQYSNLELLQGGWNEDDASNAENVEWYLSTVKGHNLKNCDWMEHDNPEIITN